MISLPLPARRIAAVFALHAMSQGGLFARIPDLQLSLGMDATTLGLVLLGQPAGAILSFLFASQVVERLGTRLVMLFSIPMMAVAMAGVGFAPSAFLMGVGLAVFGVFFALANVAINVEADRTEAHLGRHIMNTCHGLWSVGLLVTTLVATLARAAAIPVSVHFGLTVIPVLLGTLYFALPMQPAPPRPHAPALKRFRVATLTPLLLPLLGYSIASSLLEGGLRNWSVIFMRDNFSAPDWVDTLTLPCFVAAQSIGRLLGDWAVARFGPVRLARVLALVALAGTALVVFSPNLELALLGFVLIGAGVCISFPLSTTAAARLGDRPASENVAALTMAQQLLLLGAPALLGLIADTLSIRATFAVMIPPMIAALWLARYLAPRPQPHAG